MLKPFSPIDRPSRIRRTSALVSLITSPLVAALACSGGDLTEFDLEVPAEGPPAESEPVELVETEAEQLERLRAENQAFIEERIRESHLEYEALTDEQRAALEAAPPPSPESIRAAWLALENATLSPEEELAVLELFSADGAGDPELQFRGRTVVREDVLHAVDDLLELDEGTGVTEKALVEKPVYASIANGQFLFRRPETNRTYYVVVPNAVPQSIMDALLLATNAIHTALSDDCLSSNLFVPIRQSAYASLSPSEQQLSSVIDFGYGPDVCPGGIIDPNDPAAGCANTPFTQVMMISPGLSATRMRFGSFVRLATNSSEWDPARARDIIFHEFTHILGFNHREDYPGLTTTLDTTFLRVPGTPDFTVPTATAITKSSLFTFPFSNDDKHALRNLYSGQCAYNNNARVIASVCSTANEQICQRHGATCERSSNGTQQCRWHHHRNSTSCGDYSLGNWITTNPLPGETGSCISPASTVASFYSNEASCFGQQTTQAQDLAGRCCSQGFHRIGQPSRPGVLFRAFGGAFATTFVCSEQPNLWDPGDWDSISWEFNPADEDDFMDPVTGGAAEGWEVRDLAYEQRINLTDNMLIARLVPDEVRYGCLSTLVTTPDDDESGIVFGYQNLQNYFVFDVTPSVRRRIRRVQNGVSTDLSNIPINIQTTWTPGIKLAVCFTDGAIHTFINNAASRVSVLGAFNFSGSGGRYPGLWNSWNDNARHDYLRTSPVINGFLGLF